MLNNTKGTRSQHGPRLSPGLMSYGFRIDIADAKRDKLNHECPARRSIYVVENSKTLLSRLVSFSSG